MLSADRRPNYTVLRATVRRMDLLRLVRFQTGQYGVLQGEVALYIAPADIAGRRRAITAYEAATAGRSLDAPRAKRQWAADSTANIEAARLVG